MRRCLVRTLVCTSLFLSLAVPLLAEGPQLTAEQMWFRNTAASDVARQANWAQGGLGQVVSGFADSLVFRKGAATRTLVDTSAAYAMARFPMPPGLAYRTSAAIDTLDSTPWIIIRVKQDTLRSSFSGASAMDSLLFAAEFSDDGINWASVAGTPTRAFDGTAIAAANGAAPPALLAAEVNAGDDAAYISINCHPQISQTGGYIVNRTLCICSAKWVRFLVGVSDGVGQYAVDILHW